MATMAARYGAENNNIPLKMILVWNILILSSRK